MPLLTSLLLLILVARILGEIAQRFGQPKLIGEIFSGIILGPAFLGWVEPSKSLHGISELAVFLVILSAGLEMKFKDVVHAFKGKGLVVALIGFLLPLLCGVALGTLFQMDPVRSLFLGLCIAITALPVAIRILESFKMLNTDIAKYAVSTAIVNDILALLALGIILEMPGQQSFGPLMMKVGTGVAKLGLFGIAIYLAHWVITHLETLESGVDRTLRKITEWFGKEAIFSLLIMFILVFSAVSEILGFHFVIGAFFGALLLTQELFGRHKFVQLESTVASISAGFLAPIFFAYIGLQFDLTALKSVSLVSAVLAVSVASKIVAGWLGGRLLGMSHRRGVGLGIILNGRGIMELVVASIAFEKGFINASIFSTLVLMGVFTTVITPLLFQRLKLTVESEA